MCFTIQTLFELSHHRDTVIQDIKKFAWRGDCILKHHVNKYLWEKYESRSVGFLNSHQDFLLSNKLLARFLDDATDILKDAVQIHWGAGITLNEHSKGTVFEWLLYQTSLLDDKGATGRAVLRYIEWAWSSMTAQDVADANIAAKVTDDVDEPSVESVLKFHLQPNAKAISTMVNELKANPTMLYSSSPFLKRGKEALPHCMDLVTFEWMSRARNVYEDSFYGCCGMRAGDQHCLRADWANRNRHHPGKLRQVLYGGKKAGGGRCTDGSSLDHIPRMMVPLWTCCNEPAPAEGCESTPASTASDGTSDHQGTDSPQRSQRRRFT